MKKNESKKKIQINFKSNAQQQQQQQKQYFGLTGNIDPISILHVLIAKHEVDDFALSSFLFFY